MTFKGLKVSLMRDKELTDVNVSGYVVTLHVIFSARRPQRQSLHCYSVTLCSCLDTLTRKASMCDSVAMHVTTLTPLSPPALTHSTPPPPTHTELCLESQLVTLYHYHPSTLLFPRPLMPLTSL